MNTSSGTPLRIVSCDIGGTHARFAIAEIVDGKVNRLHEPAILKTSNYASFELALRDFNSSVAGTLPDKLAIALAGPADGKTLKLTNSAWIIRPDDLRAQLGIAQLTIVNDFGAVALAVATLDTSCFQHLCGPEGALPPTGVITVLGPGTGLGVAAVLRNGGGTHILETEGGHIDFAPTDSVEDDILAVLRKRFGRVSVERLVSGSGLANIRAGMVAIDGSPETASDDKALWQAALDGSYELASAALDRFCMILGSVAGDLALAQGAGAVVIAGGLGLRISGRLPSSAFCERFVAKGRFRSRMEQMPVKLLVHPQPGLLGAAAAFAKEHG